ncbi:MAG: RNA polymerase sigma-70 factor [Tannerellaceae bacterium]|jgi:RNA polymerase sigma-70 factor (ECF subfamily)|nr:RNA polymerase sigma-70 factor [Tannerellaceae bacterium]
MNSEDINAFQWIEALFKSRYKPLRAYAYRFVNDKYMAEDIVQDVFLELWARRDSIRFHDTEAVRAWLFTSVYHRSINALMRKRPDKQLTLDHVQEAKTVESFLNPYIQNQEESLILKELDHEIAGFIKTLPPQCKKVFTLSRSTGLKNIEIAEQLGISIKAVEKQIGKALRELKNHLKKQGFF